MTILLAYVLVARIFIHYWKGQIKVYCTLHMYFIMQSMHWIWHKHIIMNYSTDVLFLPLVMICVAKRPRQFLVFTTIVPQNYQLFRSCMFVHNFDPQHKKQLELLFACFCERIYTLRDNEEISTLYLIVQHLHSTKNQYWRPRTECQTKMHLHWLNPRIAATR